MMTDATFCAKNRGVRDDDERRSVDDESRADAPFDDARAFGNASET